MTVERVPQTYRQITVEGNDVERVESFCYLGHWIAANASIESEMQARINRSTRSWGRRCRSGMGRRQLPGRTKCILFVAIIILSLAYGDVAGVEQLTA